MNYADEKGIKTDAGREEIVFGERIEWSERTGGIARFDTGDSDYLDGGPIAPATGRELLDQNYLAPDDRQNAAPTAEELVEFTEDLLEQHPDCGVGLIGYVVSPERSDARISIEGFAVKDASPGLVGQIDARFDADEMFPHGSFDYRVWWD